MAASVLGLGFRATSRGDFDAQVGRWRAPSNAAPMSPFRSQVVLRSGTSTKYSCHVHFPQIQFDDFAPLGGALSRRIGRAPLEHRVTMSGPDLERRGRASGGNRLQMKIPHLLSRLGIALRVCMCHR